jgi:hypothetical protein
VASAGPQILDGPFLPPQGGRRADNPTDSANRPADSVFADDAWPLVPWDELIPDLALPVRPRHR